MQIIGPPAVLAPQTAGHPAALPDGTASAIASDHKVKPINPGSDAAGLNRRDRPTAQHKENDRPSAPPTALQLEIETMLAEQAEKLEQNRKDHAIPTGLPGQPTPMLRV